MSTESAVARLRGDGRGWTLLAIAVGWVFVLGGRYLVPAVLPQVKETFLVGDFEAGVAVTVVWATYALMQSPAGLLTDRVGERRLLTGSLLLTGGSVLVLGVSPVFLAFLGGCAAFGFTTGLYGPPRGTALSRTFPENDGTAIGATLAAGAVGSAVLPFLAGALVGTVSWRWVVAGLAPPLLVAGAFAWGAVPERERSADPDVPPLSDLARDVYRAVRMRGVAVAVAAVTLMLFGFQGLTAFFVTYLVETKGFDQTTAAAMFSLLFVGAALAQFFGGSLADRFGERPVLVGISVAGVPLLAAVPFVDGLVPVALLSFVLGTRLGITSVTNAYVIAVLPDAVTGTAWGVLRTLFFLLGAGGSTVVGAMADADLFAESFYLLAGLTALAAVCYAFLPTREAVRAGYDEEVGAPLD
jgi:predicted MFS family arabinose efflux permease